MRSILLGTAGLSLAAVAALFLTITRAPWGGPPSARTRVRRLAAMTIALHAAHFSEELIHGFHERFPDALGLAPWPVTFFVVFNVGWMATWGLSLASLQAHPRWALFPLWFLAMGSAANGVAHPLLAAARGGYFPGLATSPFVGMAGVLLLVSLARVTRPDAASQGRDSAL